MVTIRRPTAEPELSTAAARQFKTAVKSKERLKTIILKPLIDHIKSDTRNSGVVRVGTVGFRKRVRFVTKEVRAKWTLHEFKKEIAEMAASFDTLTSVNEQMEESKRKSEYGNRYKLTTVNVITDTLPPGLDAIRSVNVDPKHNMQSYEPENGMLWATADNINKDLMTFMRLFKATVQRDLGLWRPDEAAVRALPERGKHIHYDKIRGQAFMIHVKPKISTDHDNIVEILDSILANHGDVEKILEKIQGESVAKGIRKFVEIEGRQIKTHFRRLLNYIKGLEREKIFGVDFQLSVLE